MSVDFSSAFSSNRREFLYAGGAAALSLALSRKADAAGESAAGEWRNRNPEMAYRRLGRTNYMISEVICGGNTIAPDNFRHVEEAIERRAEVSRLFAQRLETAFPGKGAGKIYEWDPAKRKEARKKHGVDFASMIYFDWGTAVGEEEDSEDVDGETRQNVYGFIEGRLHRATYTERDGKMRMITLRKADKREVLSYNKRK